MKNLKKALAAILAAAMTMAIMVVPASAETITRSAATLTFTPPSSPWETLESETVSDGTDNRTYSLYDSAFEYLYVYFGDGNSPYAIDQTYLDDYTNPNGITFKHYTATSEGNRYVYEDGNVFVLMEYGCNTPSRPNFDELLKMVNSVSLTGAQSSGSAATSSAPSSSSSTTTTTTKDGKTTTTTTTTTTTSSSSSDTIKIYVNGSRVYPDSDPVIINDRTLVPIRVVAEALGYQVDWVASERAVDIHNDFAALYLIIGSSSINRYTYGYAGEITSLDTLYADVAPQIINDRTYLPLRAVGEGLGAKVEWDGSTRSVYITSGSVG